MHENDWFVTRLQKAQAYVRSEVGGLLLRMGSSPIREAFRISWERNISSRAELALIRSLNEWKVSQTPLS